MNKQNSFLKHLLSLFLRSLQHIADREQNSSYLELQVREVKRLHELDFPDDGGTNWVFALGQ